MDNRKSLCRGIILTLLASSVCACADTKEPAEKSGEENVVQLNPSKDEAEEITGSIVTESAEPETSYEFAESEKTSKSELVADGEYSDSVEDQLRLIADCYDQWRQITIDEGYSVDFFMIAVTDLNRNGRLELIITTLQGTGYFSSLGVFEVDETFTSMKSLTGTPVFWNNIADFRLRDVFECYKQDDRYYYVVEDRYRGGWGSMSAFLYLFSFDGEVKGKQVSGFVMYVKDLSTKDIDTYLYDSEGNNFTDKESYRTYMQNVWNGYEKQPSVKLVWCVFPEKEECADALHESYGGYDPDSSEPVEEYMDFENYYGEDYEYKVVQ